MWATYLNYVYTLIVLLISLFGLHELILTALFFITYRKIPRPAPEPDVWPLVAVQLPIYNEKHVVARLIDAVCAFDYPLDRLEIQVLDDSTDDTTELLRERIAHYQALGFNIQLYHREQRQGFKAGALQEATQMTAAEYAAIFDADFIPAPDFLKRTIPHFLDNPRMGMVEGRWGHLNRQYNLVTRAQAIYLDGHLVVQQTARNRSGLLFNFNGSNGVWRTECVRDSGGWQPDTLAEDLDLSYRAQLRGWQMRFLPDLVTPAELPPTWNSFKKQQYRWAYGAAQVMIKSLGRLWNSPRINLAQRLEATMHLSTGLAQMMGLLLFLISLPMALLHPAKLEILGLISLTGLGPSVLYIASQMTAHKDGLRRLLSLPLWIALGLGLSISTSRAVILALLRRPGEWTRTPKYSIQGKKEGGSGYIQSIDPTIYAEFFMAIYMAFGLGIAIERDPSMIPLMVLGLLSFGLVSAMGMVEVVRLKKEAGQAQQTETA